MSQIVFRRPPWIIQDEVTSWSGKYRIFLGRHYHEAGKECWIVAAYNVMFGTWTERHYNLIPWPGQEGVEPSLLKASGKPYNSCQDPKSEALAAWADFRTEMERKPEHEQTEDADAWWETKVKPLLRKERRAQGISEDDNNPIM